ncbi:MAG: PhzF family phenazine biosynthesis protein [Candidatus Eremiobacteraeota bacterium]|nr:PhzF family phenazine biosynthesis protein [Candidatus Eremiobacteraeota bacterium]
MHQSVRHYRYMLLDVFTKTRLEGNPLAVFPEAQGISDLQMQQIAGELNLSETVFLTISQTGAAARARIFTPRRELDFAGHPTIGTAHVLNHLGERSVSFGIQENVGTVPIEVATDADGDPVFWLTTPSIQFYETLGAELCAELLGLATTDLASAPPQFVSAGSPFLFIALKDRQAVDRAVLNAACLPKALGSANSVGTFVFARTHSDPGGPFDVHARMFAPQTGIAEDPATGGATGPLAAYMLEHGLASLSEGTCEFISEQGVKMGRRSVLRVRVSSQDDALTIKVGGSAIIVAEGTFLL